MKNETIKKEFGRLLCLSRKRACVTQENMARTLGVSVRTVSNWEKGCTFIEDLSIIDDVERLYGINLSLLLDEAIKDIRSRGRKS